MFVLLKNATNGMNADQRPIKARADKQHKHVKIPPRPPKSPPTAPIAPAEARSGIGRIAGLKKTTSIET